MKDLVVDIETLGIEYGSKVLSIAAVSGDNRFYKVISNPEGTIDEDTLNWWNQCPSVLARNEVFQPNENSTDLRSALVELVQFINENHCERFWGCSPDFDFGHLAYWMKKYQIDIPWQFWQLRDIRTIRDFIPKEKIEMLNQQYLPNDQRHIAIVDVVAEYALLNTVLLNVQFVEI